MVPTELPKDDQTRRKGWMSVLSKAKPAALKQVFESWGAEPAHTILRAPEIGGVMVRGRAGATGAAFNLGEMTVTRCSVRLSSGEIGHSYVQGRSRDHARQAALVDALMQSPAASAVERSILNPLAKAALTRRNTRAAKAATTKVDFTTLMRGED